MNTVTTHGPMFAGNFAEMVIERMGQENQRDVAQEGVNRVQAHLGRVLRNPTGYYSSNVTTDNSVAESSVTDSGVVYGPWLEGVSSMNDRTRFKGYHTFRIIGQELQGDVAGLIDSNVSRAVKELG